MEGFCTAEDGLDAAAQLDRDLAVLQGTLLALPARTGNQGNAVRRQAPSPLGTDIDKPA